MLGSREVDRDVFGPFHFYLILSDDFVSNMLLF